MIARYNLLYMARRDTGIIQFFTEDGGYSLESIPETVRDNA